MTEGTSPHSDDVEGVPPGTHLIRRINPRFCDWDELDSEGRPRITRQAVQFYRNEEAKRLGCPGPAMSFVMDVATEHFEELARRYPGYGLARMTADELRVGGALGVQLWPTPEEPLHVVVFRVDGASKPTGTQARRIAEVLRQGWLVVPSPPTGSAANHPPSGA